MTKAIIVLNAGSSSIKYALYEASDRLIKLSAGQVSRIGQAGLAPLYESLDQGLEDTDLTAETSHKDIMSWLISQLKTKFSHLNIIAAGHRVVHGGQKFMSSVELTPEILDELQSLCALAPNHQPFNLIGINAIEAAWPSLSQVACFDTSFHRTQPKVAQLFPLNHALAEEGIIRYGFHGLSYDYISSVLQSHIGDKSTGRILVLHLGHGCSICAIKNGKSIATTMAYTALSGLMMGKRCGDIDPGVMLHLMRSKNMDANALENLLGNHSGLLGMSEISDDMRDLLASKDEKAIEAVELFIYKVCQSMGSLIATLEGIDAIVFTGGIGENSAEIRQRICEKFRWLDVHIDKDKNSNNEEIISATTSSIPVLALKTNEELIIAKHTAQHSCV